MAFKFEAKYARVDEGTPLCITALNCKNLADATYNSFLLENATVIVGDNKIIEIRGTLIKVFRHWKFGWFDNIDEKEIPSLGIIYNPKTDIVRTPIFRRRVLEEGLYELERKSDYQLIAHVPWSIESSNGEVLSSEELA